MRSTPTTTDGWRGLPGPAWSELHLLAAIDHAAASGALGDRVLVGFDTRAGSAELAALAADLLTTRNITAIVATGPAPTPAFGLFTHAHPELTGAVIATASHNPPGYIGIKLRDAHGQGIAWTQPAANTVIAPPAVHSSPHRRVDVTAFYNARIGRPVADAARRFHGHLIIDAAHGAVAALAPHLPQLDWHRARPLPFFAGATPDPAARPAADKIAATALRAAAAPDNTMVAMIDGDGDRLALFTARSGYVASPEQAAILLRTGLPATRLITTTVAPGMITHAARSRNLEVTHTPVGFKHIITAQRDQPEIPTLGVEPNGALAWSDGNGGYFERDSLTALATITTRFTGVQDLDDAVADLRRDHPYPQQIITVPAPAQDTIDRLQTLLGGWRATARDDVIFFEDGSHSRVAVRASGTEPGTRLYLETDPATTDRVSAAINDM